MYMPRLHRRKLFFPPGMLALAWLLLLGCVALQQDYSSRPRPNVLQVGFPILHVRGDNSFHPPVYASDLTLEAYCQWKTYYLSSNPWADFFTLKFIRKDFQQLVDGHYNDKLHGRTGIRIRLTPNARYSSFIQVIDLFNQYGIKLYWIDILHEPTTFYTISSRSYPKYDTPTVFGCGGFISSDFNLPIQKTINPPVNLFSLDSYASLFQERWWASTIILLLMGMLSIRQGQRITRNINTKF